MPKPAKSSAPTSAPLKEVEAPHATPTHARNPRELDAWRSRFQHRAPMRLDQALLDLGLITADKLEQARETRLQDPSQPMGVILQRLGSATPESINAGLAYQLGVPAVDLRHWPLDRSVLSLIPGAVVQYYGAVPIHLEGNVLYVAMSDVLNREVIDAMQFSTPLSIQPLYAPESEVQWMLGKCYVGGVSAPVSDEDLARSTGQYSAERNGSATLSQVDASDNVIVRLADQIIAEAYRERASDVHIEPLPAHGKTVVRVRIDGRMFTRRSIPWAYRDALVSRLKVMANLNVAEHRVPQDGKIVFRKSGGMPIELRIAILPTAGGVEDVVLRILDASTALPLTALGLCDADQHRLQDLIEKPYGILLVCGPTGSGKTTTLHAVLRHLNDGARKILTVENPVEIMQAGLRQVEVNPKAGLTFAAALRAFLRSDPDVIMVGEIRDPETAKTALEASLTGHLVLATLHTNTAPESVVRLVEMGMNPFNFSDSLIGVLAQRLVRCLCKHCREPVDAGDDLLLPLAREYSTGLPDKQVDHNELIAAWRGEYGVDGRIVLYRARGCGECSGTGYKGRIGLLELMSASSEIKRMIIDGASAAALFDVAVAQGMQTLKQDGIHKVLSGITELSQVLAVSQR